MYEYYDNYKKTSSVDEKERWARQLIWEVARHAVGEEIVVYPLMEQHLGMSSFHVSVSPILTAMRQVPKVSSSPITTAKNTQWSKTSSTRSNLSARVLKNMIIP
jgi:hypothetical protein